ncbi:hypothetical protein [Vibrio vulnificus]|uniref:hypothetical protein n=1 Tax=Vibrio vulnificus TaxID=672 RepID=UPI0032EE59A3
MRYFLSDNHEGGGIAFNVKSLCNRFSDAGIPCEIMFLNVNFFDELLGIVKKDDTPVLYTTSGKSLLVALFISILRGFMFRHTYVAPIVYHPRFADPSVSKFRSLINRSLKYLSTNLVYYCDEAKSATKIHQSDCSERIIGLSSNFEYIDARPIVCPELDDPTFLWKVSTIGRLVDFKMGYIRSLIEFAKNHPNVLVMIGGFGPHEKEVIDESAIIQNLVYLGKLSIEESKYLVNRSDLFIGMGTTLADSVVAGTPAIVAIESNKNGFTTGYFGNDHSICYGEYSSEKTYFDLGEFLGDIVKMKLTERPDPVEVLIQPFERLLSVEPSFELLPLHKAIFSMFYLLAAFTSRKLFNQPDYH